MTLTYRHAQRKRRQLVELGVEPWIVNSTSSDKLDELLQRAWDTRVVLVADVDELTDDDVCDIVPRIGVSRLDPIDVRMRRDGCTEDEIASVLTYVRGTLVEAPSLHSGVVA